MNWRGLVFPVALLAAAELAAETTQLRSDSLAAPSDIARAVWDALLDRSLLRATAQTLIAAFGGLALGAGAGLVAGLALGLMPRLAGFSALSIEMLRPIPAVAIIPLMLLVFGFGYRMEIAVVAFATFWPLLILTWHGLRQVDVRLIEVASIMNLEPLSRVWKIILPAAAPRLFTALRLAAALALVVGVTVEIAANPQGLGYGIMIAQETLRPDRMLAMLVWLGVVGFALNDLLVRAERRLFAHRGDADAGAKR